MEPMKIIGITGRARSGKDTLASLILKNVHSGQRLSFAAPIRQFIATLTDIPMSELVDGPRKEQPLAEFGGKSPRQMMQTLGTEWGRDLINRDLWITVARKRIEKIAALPPQSRPDVVIFSDVRFENEAAMIRQMGGTVVHLFRPDSAAVNEHASEQGIEMHAADATVDNSGDLTDLQWHAERVYLRSWRSEDCL